MSTAGRTTAILVECVGKCVRITDAKTTDVRTADVRTTDVRITDVRKTDVKTGGLLYLPLDYV